MCAGAPNGRESLESWVSCKVVGVDKGNTHGARVPRNKESAGLLSIETIFDLIMTRENVNRVCYIAVTFERQGGRFCRGGRERESEAIFRLRRDRHKLMREPGECGW